MTLHDIIRVISKRRLEEENSTRTDIIHRFWDSFFWGYDISPLRMMQTLTVIKNKISLTHTTQPIDSIYSWPSAPVIPKFEGSQCVMTKWDASCYLCSTSLNSLILSGLNYAAVGGERQIYCLLYSDTFGIVTRLQAGQSAVQFLVGVGDFSILQNTQTSSGAYPPSYSVGINNSFQRSKVTGAWSLRQTFVECSG